MIWLSSDHTGGPTDPIAVQIISPWAQHGKVINTYYSQIQHDPHH